MSAVLNVELFPLTGAREVPVDLIVPGKYQPRKRFSEQEMKELADNVRAKGIKQPILLRPVGKVFEIVAGERRWRASKMADKETIPAVIEEMTLMEALEFQAIENLQREDLHDLEEAFSFNILMHPPEGERGYTVAEVAVKVSKEVSYVRRRLVLCQLIPQACDAFLADQIVLSTAIAIARMPVDIQAKAFPKIMATRPAEDKPVLHKDAERILLGAYMLRLSQAPFPIKDATLVPDAGGCNVCPKRTGASPDLFFDIDDADTCTDPDCHGQKMLAWNERRKKEARDAGIEVIDGKKASALLKFGPDSTQLNADYVYMDQPLEDLTGSKSSLQKLLGTLLKPSALYEHPRDKTLREIVHTHKAQQVLKDQGLLVMRPTKGEQAQLVKPAGQAKGKAPSKATLAAEREAEERDRARREQRLIVERAWRSKVFTGIHKAMHNAGECYSMLLLREAVIDMGLSYLDDADNWPLMCDLWGWVEGEDYQGEWSLRDRLVAVIEPLALHQLLILQAELVLLPELDPPLSELDDKAHPDAARKSLLARACADEEADLQVDWEAIRDRVMNPRKAKKGKTEAAETIQSPTNPTSSPSPAGESKGSAAKKNVAVKPATKDKSQAPSAQTRNEGSDLPHWVGQMVKVKVAKRVGEVVGIKSDGALYVGLESWRTGKEALRVVASNEVIVLPDQVQPDPWTKARIGHVVERDGGIWGRLVEKLGDEKWLVKSIPSPAVAWPFPQTMAYRQDELTLTGEYRPPASDDDAEGSDQ